LYVPSKVSPRDCIYGRKIFLQYGRGKKKLPHSELNKEILQRRKNHLNPLPIGEGGGDFWGGNNARGMSRRHN